MMYVIDSATNYSALLRFRFFMVGPRSVYTFMHPTAFTWNILKLNREAPLFIYVNSIFSTTFILDGNVE
jgi:hypothetical protein